MPRLRSVNRQLDPTLVKLMNAGQLNIDLHFLNFQNNKSSDNYSNRVFNGAIYIAEHDDDPDHLMSYLSNIYAEDFQPGELSNYEPVNNAKLEKQAVKAANQAQSQVNQTEAVGHMVRDQMLQNKEAVSGCFAQAYGRRHRSRKRFVGASGLGLRP